MRIAFRLVALFNGRFFRLHTLQAERVDESLVEQRTQVIDCEIECKGRTIQIWSSDWFDEAVAMRDPTSSSLCYSALNRNGCRKEWFALSEGVHLKRRSAIWTRSWTLPRLRW